MDVFVVAAVVVVVVAVVVVVGVINAAVSTGNLGFAVNHPNARLGMSSNEDA